MADSEVGLRLSLKDRKATAQGLREIKGDLDQMGDAADKAGKKAEASSSRWSKVSKVAGGALGTIGKTALYGAAGLGALGAAAGVWAFKSATAIQTATMNLTTLTGSADKAKNMVAQLNKYGNATTFDTGPLAEAAQQMLTYGIASKDVVPDMKMLGDIAMGNQEKLSGLAFVFAQVQGNGHLMGQDLLQMINQGFNPLVDIAKRTGKTMGQVRDEMSKGKISFDDVKQSMVDATKKGGQFYNGAKNGAATVAGAWGNLTGTLSSGLGMALQPVLPLVSQVLGRMSDLATKAIPVVNSGIKTAIRWGKRLGDAFGVLFGGGSIDKRLDSFADGLDYAFGNTGKLAEPLGIAFGAVADAVSKVTGIAAQARPTLATLASTFKTQVLPGIMKVASYVAKSLVPIFAQVVNIIGTKLVPIGIQLAQFWATTIAPAMLRIYATVATKLKPVFDQLVTTIKTQVLPTVSRLADIFKTQILPALEPIISKLLTVSGFLIKLGVTILGAVLPPLIKFAGFLLKTLVPAAADIIAVVLQLINTILGLPGAAVHAAAVVGTAFKAVGKAGQWLWDKALRPAFKFIVDGFLTVASVIVNGADKAFGWIPGLGGKLKGAAKAVDGFKDDFNKALGGIQETKTVKINIQAVDTSGAGVAKLNAKHSGGFKLSNGAGLPQGATGGVIRRRPGGLTLTAAEGRWDEALVPMNGRRYLIDQTGVTALPTVSPVSMPAVPEFDDAPAPAMAGATAAQRPIHVHVDVDRKTIAEAVLDGLDDKGARQ